MCVRWVLCCQSVTGVTIQDVLAWRATAMPSSSAKFQPVNSKVGLCACWCAGGLCESAYHVRCVHAQTPVYDAVVAMASRDAPGAMVVDGTFWAHFGNGFTRKNNMGRRY